MCTPRGTLNYEISGGIQYTFFINTIPTQRADVRNVANLWKLRQPDKATHLLLTTKKPSFAFAFVREALLDLITLSYTYIYTDMRHHCLLCF